MSELLPSNECCGNRCPEDIITDIPGPQGPSGTAGTNGTNGYNAYTYLTAGFTMPVEGANVSVSVANASWMVPSPSQNSIVFVESAGYMQVVSVATSLAATLKNISDSAAGDYPDNAPPATPIPNASRVSPAGIQGPPGQDGASGAPDDAFYFLKTTNASLPNGIPMDAVSTGPALLKIANDGTPSAAVDGTDYLSPMTGLEPADIGVLIQPYNAKLGALAGLSPTGSQATYFTSPTAMALYALTANARTFNATSYAGMRTLLGTPSGYGVLGYKDSVNLNAAATDNPITMGSASYIIDKVTVCDSSGAVSLATAGVFTGGGGGGTALALDQALSALTTSLKYKNLTLEAVVGTDKRTETTLYFRIGTANGSAMTADVRFWGWDLTTPPQS